MTTTAYELKLADGWVEVALDTVDTLLLDNQGQVHVQFTFAASAPATTAPYHLLPPGAVVPRLGEGKIYMRNHATVPCKVVVS
jgi:hypothetical protein